MPGSFSNATWLIEGERDGRPVRIVARRYRGGWSDPGGRARREFQALQIAERVGIPVAKPIVLDDVGELLGWPGIVVSYVDGRQTFKSGDRAWVREMAHVLAAVHSVRCPQAPALPSADEEALWFTNTGEMTEAMRFDRDGAAVWEAVQAHRGSLAAVAPALVHLDYWTGNLLWRAGRIAAVVDWEEASCGDPAIDVAYLRRDLWGLGMREEADWFLDEYQSATGGRVRNLAFWELAAAVRSMPDPEKGVESQRALGVTGRTPADLIRAHHDFIEGALRRVG
jgi:aminoglycoside phosphotransferase (APT) family kinase protein